MSAESTRHALRDAGAAIARARAELLVAAAFLAGWALVTLGVTRLVGHAPVVWAFSGGLLCLSLGGWRLLGTIALDGLYALTRPASGGPRG